MKIKMREIRQAHTPLERRLSRRLRHAPSGACLDFEQIVEVARRRRRASDYYARMTHIISCPACRRAYLQARQIIEAQRPSLVRWFKRFRLPITLTFAPATAVAAVVFAVMLWQARTPQTLGEPTVIAATPDLPAGAETLSSRAQPQIAESRLTAPSAPPLNTQEELRRARQLPAFVGSAVAWMQQSVAQLAVRSDEQPKTPWLRLSNPDIESNSAIEPGTVFFQWAPVANATGCQVRLTRADQQEPIAEATLNPAQTRLTLDKPLRPGEYTLTITVLQGEESQTFRREFYVLNAEQQRALRWARENAQQYPLLSAAVFYENDRYTDALRCIERASKEYPNDRLVDQWRKQVESRIRQRLAEFEK
jgi:Flp pilus assembly protein CpaB